MNIAKTPLRQLALFTLALVSLCTGAFSAVTTDSHGWTVVTPSSDSIVVYVSSSEGDDANDGLSPSTPKETILAGNALLRDGYPDHLLLKRGDTFEVESGWLLSTWKSGRSASEPILCSYYGSSGPRPVVKVDDYFVNSNGNLRDYQAFIGLDIYKSNSDPASPDFDNSSCNNTFRFVGGGADVLVEDCRIRFGGISIQSYGGDGQNQYTNPKIRRNIITDAWRHGSYLSHSGRIQGLWVSNVKEGYTIEENFFDHGGWNETVPNAGANMYNHNVYIQYSNVEGGIIRGNIVARGAAHGIQARSGGLVDRNLFILNAVALNVGGHGAPEDPDVYTFPNRARENVALSGRLMDPNDTEAPRTTAVWGIGGYSELPGTAISDNIVANRVDDGTNRSYYATQYGDFYDNISYNWWSELDTFDSAWPHPDNDIGDYFASLGGSNDTIDYLEWLRDRPVGELPWNMTAYSAINYIRAGFNKSAVSGYYQYTGASSVAATGVSLDPSTLTIQEGSGGFLIETVSPSNATNKAVTWSSSNGAVASVENDGFVTGESAGTATITVTTDDGSFTDSSLVTVQASSSGDPNLSEGQSTIASAWQDDSNGYQPPASLVDGDTSDQARWSAYGFSHWVEIDLGAQYDLSEIRLHPYQNRAYQYTVQVSADGNSYNTIVDRSSNTDGGSVLTDSVSGTGRYVRLTVTGASGYSGSWVSINELQVFGTQQSGGGSTVTQDFESLSVGDQDSVSVTLGDYVFADFRVAGGNSQTLQVVSVAGTIALRHKNYDRSLRITRSDNAAFDLASFDMATGSSSLTVSDAFVTAYNDGSQVATTTVSDSSGALTTFTFNWSNVDEVVIDFHGGTNTVWGFLDNFVFSN